MNLLLVALITAGIINTGGTILNAKEGESLNKWNYAEIACATARLPLVVAAQRYEEKHSKKSRIIASLADIARITNALLHAYNQPREINATSNLVMTGANFIRLSSRIIEDKPQELSIKELQNLNSLDNDENKKSNGPKLSRLQKILPFIEGLSAIYKALDNTEYEKTKDNTDFNKRYLAYDIETLSQSASLVFEAKTDIEKMISLALFINRLFDFSDYATWDSGVLTAMNNALS